MIFVTPCAERFDSSDGWRVVCLLKRLRRDNARTRNQTPLRMLREFKDSAGIQWQVWDVYPARRAEPSKSRSGDATPGVSAFPHRELSDGWLCFQSAGEKRRLTPIPPEWEICDCSALESLCVRAGYISQSD